MKNLLLLIPLSFLFFISCNKDDDTYQTGEEPPKQYAEAEFTISICSDIMCTSTEPVAGARIYLYGTIEDRDDGGEILIEGITSTNGIYTFTTLDAPEYWYTVVMPQPDGRIIKDYTKTPARSKSLETVLFLFNE